MPHGSCRSNQWPLFASIPQNWTGSVCSLLRCSCEVRGSWVADCPMCGGAGLALLADGSKARMLAIIYLSTEDRLLSIRILSHSDR